MASQGHQGREKTGHRAVGFLTVLSLEGDLHWPQLNYSTLKTFPGKLGAVVFPEGHGVTGMQMASSRLGCVQVLSPVHPSLLPWSRGFPGPSHLGQCSYRFVCECESEKSKVEEDISWVLQVLLWQ